VLEGTALLEMGVLLGVGELDGTGVLYRARVVGTCTAIVEYLEAAEDAAEDETEDAAGVLPAPEPTVAVPVEVMAEVVWVRATAPEYMVGPGTVYEAMEE
jgi:hypothetical protein